MKNKIDGSVEMEVQGTEDKINDVLVRIKKGHGTIRVDQIKMEEIDVIPEDHCFFPYPIAFYSS